MTEFYICERLAIQGLSNKRYTTVYYMRDKEIGYKFGDNSSSLVLVEGLTGEELVLLALKGHSVIKADEHMFSVFLKSIIVGCETASPSSRWYYTSDTLHTDL